jgi:GNAT superfamily N-acetyltransferase
MKFKTKDNRSVKLEILKPDKFSKLLEYLECLSPESKIRFGPHPFTENAIQEYHSDPDSHRGYIVQTADSKDIIAYTIIKFGYLEGDYNRYVSYGLDPDNSADCELAPSVADDWQSCGIGNAMFKYIVSDLRESGIKRIVLWGGVQADNQKAINYYSAIGFRQVGQFTHNGENFDMILNI